MKKFVSCWASRLMALAFVLAFVATSSAATPTPSNWLNAKISEYTGWPTLGVTPEGGAWAVSSGSESTLADMATLETDPSNQLVIDTQDGDLEFNATTAASLADGSVDIATTMEFVPASSTADLPDATSSKAGVAVLTNATEGTLTYYVVAKGDEGNEWQAFGGTVEVTLSATVAIAIANESSATKVTYTINGVASTVTVASIDTVAGVAYNGSGKVSALSATETMASFPLTEGDLSAKHIHIDSVTADGVTVEGVENVYTIPNGAQVVITFAADTCYTASGDMTKTIDAMTGAVTIDSSTEGLPTVAEKWFQVGEAKCADKTALANALAAASGDVTVAVHGVFTNGDANVSIATLPAEITSITIVGANFDSVNNDYKDEFSPTCQFAMPSTCNVTFRHLKLDGRNGTNHQFLLGTDSSTKTGNADCLLTFDHCQICGSLEAKNCLDSWLVTDCDYEGVEDGRAGLSPSRVDGRKSVRIVNNRFNVYSTSAINAVGTTDNTLIEIVGNTFAGNRNLVDGSNTADYRASVVLNGYKRVVVQNNTFNVYSEAIVGKGYVREINGPAIGLYVTSGSHQPDTTCWVIKGNVVADGHGSIFGRRYADYGSPVVYVGANTWNSNAINGYFQTVDAEQTEAHPLNFNTDVNLPSSIASYLEADWSDATPVMNGSGVTSASFPAEAGTYYVKPGCEAPAAPTGCTVTKAESDSAISYALTLNDYEIAIDANGGTKTVDDPTYQISDAAQDVALTVPTAPSSDKVFEKWTNLTESVALVFAADGTKVTIPANTATALSIKALWESAVTPADPGDSQVIEAKTAEEAAAKVTPSVPTTVAAQFTTEEQHTAYKAMFQSVARESGVEGQWIVTVEMKGDVADAISNEVATATKAIDVKAIASSEATTTTISATGRDGLYYQMVSGETIGGMEVTDEKMMKNGSVTLDTPKGTSAHFYKVTTSVDPQITD